MIDPEAFRGRLIIASPIPVDGRGEIHNEGLRRLIDRLGNGPAVGVAVDTLGSRGARLAPDQRARLLAAWREGLGGGRILVALAGVPAEVRRPEEVAASALAMARQAADAGADLILVDPPVALRARPDRDRLILEHHTGVGTTGLPLLVSYRREASGGIAYSPDVLAQLLARREVLGVVVDSFDSIVAFQQVEALARDLAPSKVVVSGEERFLGYSLMSGAGAALVGIGAVEPVLVAGLLDAHASGDLARFLALSAEVDRLARAIVAPPLDGVPLRLLKAMVHADYLPVDSAHDLGASRIMGKPV